MNLIFYDKNGKAVAYTVDDNIFLFNGKPVAYIANNFNNPVYTFSGRQLGWVDNGWIIDLSGCYAFFTNESIGGPNKPLRQLTPIRSVRQLLPIKNLRSIQKIKPIKKMLWSSHSDESFFQ